MGYIKIWDDQLEKLRECTTEEKGLILEACMAYQAGEEVAFPEGADGRFLRLLWASFREMLDANSRKQAANAQNGAKGGRPCAEPEENPAETEEKPNGNPTETQGKPTEAKKQETGYRKQDEGNGASHTEKDPPQVKDARARESGYVDPDGEIRPCRYDAAWMTSSRARAAVAQRVIEKITPLLDVRAAGDLHGYLMDAMKSGAPPEWIEDAAQLAGGKPARLLAMIAAEERARNRRADDRRPCGTSPVRSEPFSGAASPVRGSGGHAGGMEKWRGPCVNEASRSARMGRESGTQEIREQVTRLPGERRVEVLVC